MAPSVVFDNGVENVLLLKREPKVGLIIGRFTNRIEVYDCIQSTQGTSEWEAVVDHGCLVNRMLPLGLLILGVFGMGEGSDKNELLGNLRNVLKQIQDDAPHGAKSLKSEGIVMFIDMKNAKKCITQLEGNQVSGDVKTHSLPVLIPVTCQYCLKVALPWSDGKLSWRALSKQSVAQESLRLKEVVILDKTGTALEDFQTIGELPMENGTINLQLHRPLVSNRSIEDISVQQMITLNGILDCRVMCDPLERTSKVIDLLKLDIIQSVKSRFRVLQEDEESSGRVQTRYLPRRIWYTWQNKAQLCEYLRHDEMVGDVIDSLEESLHFRPEVIEDREHGLTTIPSQKTWDPFKPKTQKFRINPVLISILIGLLSITLGMIYKFYIES